MIVIFTTYLYDFFISNVKRIPALLLRRRNLLSKELSKILRSQILRIVFLTQV
jgi:hypothetical protein